MNSIQRVIYYTLISVIKIYQRIFLDLRVLGREPIPPGPKIYVINHISSTDPYWVLPVITEPVHVIIGPGYQSKIMGRFLDAMQQINAMPEQRKTVVERAVYYLQRGGAIFTAPEGDIQEPFRLGRFYPGVAQVYRRIQVPIVPIAVVAEPDAMKKIPMFDINVGGHIYRAVFVMRGPYYIHIGKPFMPQINNDVDEAEDDQRIMDELKNRIRDLVDVVRDEYLRS